MPMFLANSSIASLDKPLRSNPAGASMEPGLENQCLLVSRSAVTQEAAGSSPIATAILIRVGMKTLPMIAADLFWSAQAVTLASRVLITFRIM